jgi:hypothetical protein
MGSVKSTLSTKKTSLCQSLVKCCCETEQTKEASSPTSRNRKKQYHNSPETERMLRNTPIRF